MKWLDFGKVRLGYAEVGNDAPSYILNETYPSSVPVSGNGSSGINNALANPNLKSETTKAIEGGLEMRMFRNRINFNLSLYDQNTVDQILPLTTSPSSGYSTIYINAGKLNNKGVELTLGLIPLRTKDFEWEITLNWARNRNKIVELYTDAKGNKITNYQLINAPFSVTLNATVGQPFGTILGTDFVRDSATGEKLVDADGFYVYDPTLKNLGSIQPDWTGGIYNEFRWKGLNFGFLVDMKKGGKLFSTSVMFGRYSGLLEETAENGIRENGVVAEGINEEGNKNDVAIAASDYFQQFYSIAGNNVFDAGFVKLREVKLGYTFPARWTSKINVSNVNLSFIGRNLWIIKKNVPHIFGIISCTKDFEDINQNPNESEVPVTSALLTGAQNQLTTDMWDAWYNGRFGLLYSQYWAQNAYSDESRWVVRAGVNNNYWNYFYTGRAGNNGY